MMNGHGKGGICVPTRPPAEADDVGLSEYAPEGDTHGCREAGDRAVHPEDRGALLALEQSPERREHLRCEDRSMTPCDEAARDEFARGCAMPESRLATPKLATPARKSRRRPKRSLRRPAVIKVAAKASMQPETIHRTSVASACSSR